MFSTLYTYNPPHTKINKILRHLYCVLKKPTKKAGPKKSAKKAAKRRNKRQKKGGKKVEKGGEKAGKRWHKRRQKSGKKGGKNVGIKHTKKSTLSFTQHNANQKKLLEAYS